MRALRILSLSALGVVLASCVYETIDQSPCPPGGTQLTYANFGKGFMDQWCQSCHGSMAVTRLGAPGEFIFDNIEEIQRHRDRIFVRAAATNDSMPPGPMDPSIADRNRLAEWLACGAPP